MTDDTPWTPHRRITPRQPQPGEVLWTLTKGTESRRAELRDHGSGELQIYVNDQFVSGRRYESRTLAIIRPILEGIVDDSITRSGIPKRTCEAGPVKNQCDSRRIPTRGVAV